MHSVYFMAFVLEMAWYSTNIFPLPRVPFDPGVQLLTPRISKRPKFDPQDFNWRAIFFFF